MKCKNFLLLTMPDFILILFIFVLSVLGYLKFISAKENQYAYLYYRNNLVNTYRLDIDQLIRVNQNSTAEVKYGKIRMKSSNCQDKRCVKQGWSDMMPIICLPNQIVIEIKADNIRNPIHILY